MQTGNQQIEIRVAQKSDLGELLPMARKAFLEAFTEGNKMENVKTYLDKAFTVSQISDELADPASTFFIAMENEKVIGYSKVNLTPAQTDIHDPESLEIARLYVLEQYLGKGLGQALLDQALAFGTLNNKLYVWLGVWEQNPRAIRFYKKNGFVKFGTHPFPFGDEMQTDWLMRRDL